MGAGLFDERFRRNMIALEETPGGRPNRAVVDSDLSTREEGDVGNL